MFGFIKNTLKKIYSTCSSKIDALFARDAINEETLKDLERILIEADTGYKTTQAIIKNLQEKSREGLLSDSSSVKIILSEHLLSMLSKNKSPERSNVFLLIGINGSGKTTLAAKIARMQKKSGNALLVAADTFRAAAQEQLASWAEKSGTEVVLGKQGQDPASVVYEGCQKYKNGDYATLIIDTAGRLQTKTNLMKELEKIKRIIKQQLPDAQINTVLTLDAMLGQNSLEQARIFHESTHIDSIALTKMDGTGKGGIVFAVTQELDIPIGYISFGESLEDIKLFDSQEYVDGFLNA